MIQAWDTSAVYAAEAAVMAELGPGELMARAVAGLVEVTLARIEELAAHRVVALVGTGNNGADALYAVAGLAAAGVSCAAVHRAGAVHAGALAAALESGVVVVADDAKGPDAGTLDDAAVAVIAEADIVLDGILGIGGRGGLPRWGATWVTHVPETAYVIAVDVPSGQAPNGGPLHADGVFADETVTFSVLKPIHLLPPGELACGLVSVVEIGVRAQGAAAVGRLIHDDVAALWPVPGARDDKYSRGVVGIVAGGERYTGAAVLAATACAEAGAGMIRYVGPPTPTALVRAAVPEAVIGDGQVQAWVLGPGLDPEGGDPGDAAQVRSAHAALASGLPCVVDAGALDLLGAGWRREAPTLLTPHAGEAARLLNAEGEREVTRAMVEADPPGSARDLARRTGCTVLLKGATTVIAAPDGRVLTQTDAPPWLATAGAGDVLAGLLGVLLAAGLPPLEAGALGALVHGVAADRANPAGPVRALAVARALPGAIAALLRR